MTVHLGIQAVEKAFTEQSTGLSQEFANFQKRFIGRGPGQKLTSAPTKRM